VCVYLEVSMQDFERDDARSEWDIKGVVFCVLLTSNVDNTSSFKALIKVAVLIENLGGWQTFISLDKERLTKELYPCVLVCGAACMPCACARVSPCDVVGNHSTRVPQLVGVLKCTTQLRECRTQQFMEVNGISEKLFRIIVGCVSCQGGFVGHGDGA
jgi:hypothetical protein